MNADFSNLYDGKDDAAKLFASDKFKKLDANVQAEAKRQYETVKSNAKSATNLIELVKSDNFVDLKNGNIQLLLLKAFSNRPEDKVFREVIVSLAGKDDFKAFDTKLRTKVIEDLDTFATRPSYTDSKLKDDDRTFLLEKIRKTSIFSGKNIANSIVRNTLNNIVSGNIPIELTDDKSKTCGDPDGGITFGCNLPGSKTVYINKSANDAVYENFIETLCHETNHALNNSIVLPANVLDKFLNEYRAHIVGELGRGNILTAALVKKFLDKLGHDRAKTPKAYIELADFYENKKFPDYKALIDQAYKDADKKTIVDAAEMRKRLIAIKYGTPYVVGTNNTDNQ
jgi:hypothetical protein